MNLSNSNLIFLIILGPILLFGQSKNETFGWNTVLEENFVNNSNNWVLDSSKMRLAHIDDRCFGVWNREKEEDYFNTT